MFMRVHLKCAHHLRSSRSATAARLVGTTLARSSLCRFLDLQSPPRTDGFTSGQRYLPGIRRLDPLGWPGCLHVAPS
jgi:hypothetical protein